MKAIQTKFLGPTDIKGARIKAWAEGVGSVTISYPHECGEGEPAHRKAAEALCRKAGWRCDNLVAGGLPSGGYAFVPSDKDANDDFAREGTHV